MEEGVSLSLPRKGVPGDNHLPSMFSVFFTREHDSCVVFAPLSRDHIYSGGSMLPVFQSANGDRISVPGTREHGSDPFLRDHDLFVESNMPGHKEAVGVLLGYRKASGLLDSAFDEAVPTQVSRIGDGLSLDPHGSVMAMPTVETSSIMKPMPSSLSSIN